MYDVIIIGSGVSGAACARELSRYDIRACVLERNGDLCSGTSKANSGIVHAGYDAKTGSLMAKLNLEGNRLMPELAKELDIPFVQSGSFLVCLSEESMPDLEVLYHRGIANGVEGLEIIRDKKRIFEMEPNLSEGVVAVLYAPSAGIVCPFTLNIAMAENAYTNGVDFKFNKEVIGISRKRDNWLVETNDGDFLTQCVVNAAGVYADTIHNMVSDNKIHIEPRRGEYCLLDMEVGGHVNRTIFALPTILGKGVLVTPTVHGNILVGPTADDVGDKENIGTSSSGIEMLLAKSSMNVKEIPRGKVITSFAGLRAHESSHEFRIGELEEAPGFIDCASIESPGLTSSPAIGRMVVEILCAKLNLKENVDFYGGRSGIVNPNLWSMEKRQKFIAENLAYGNIICRCEMISEGEILDAIHRPLGARTLDGVKQRVRAGMGRCQGGFCMPKVMEIIHKECGIPMNEIQKSQGASTYIVGDIKENILG